MIKLSIVFAVYNHEKYVEKAIRSIMSQKILCDFEVLIGEDCSTDNSRDILKRIENECPLNYHFYYRETNWGIEENFRDLYERMKGEYFIVLEGDDYWIEPTKIQKQIDFLDNNSEYIACAHNVIVVDELSNPIDISYPECKNTEFTIADYLKRILPGQTASLLARNYYLDDRLDTSILNVPYYAGDRRKAFFLASNGKVYCFQERWSAYRYVLSEGSSFSANIRENMVTHQLDIKFTDAMRTYAKRINNIEAQKAGESLYIASLYAAMRFGIKNITWKNIIQEFSKCEYKKFVISHLISIKFRRNKKLHCR